MLKVEYGAKSPTMMYNIRSTIPDLMPEDNGNTCIFIANDCLVIKSFKKSNLHLEIPKDSLSISSAHHHQNNDTFFINLEYSLNNIRHEVKFNTIELTPKLKKKFGHELSPNELVKFVKQCREYIQTKRS